MTAPRHTDGQSRLLVVSLVVAAVAGLMFVYAPPIAALVIPGCLCIALLVLFTRAFVDPAGTPERQSWITKWTLLVFAMRVGVSLVIANVYSLVLAFGPDALDYDIGAVSIMSRWIGGIQVGGPRLAAGKEGYTYLLAGLYYVFGPHVNVGLVVNAALSAALVPIMYDTTRRLYGAHAAKVAVWMIVLLPSFVVWTSQLLREAGVLFLLALAANATCRLAERISVGSLSVLTLSCVTLFTFRANVALLAVLGFLIGLVAARRSAIGGLATGTAIVGFVILAVLTIGVGYAGFSAATGADLQKVNVARQSSAVGANSGFAPNHDISTVPGAIAFLPIGVPSFALGPFPWQVHNLTQVGGLLEAMSLWCLLPSLVRGFRRSGAACGRRWFILAVPAMLLTLSLSLLIGNFGTVVRERLQVTVLLVPFAAYGWTLRTRAREREQRARREGAAISS